jgi:hypothetical protein
VGAHLPGRRPVVEETTGLGASDRAQILILEPRSAYVLRDQARWHWQHVISPTKARRYSITFRTILTSAR